MRALRVCQHPLRAARVEPVSQSLILYLVTHTNGVSNMGQSTADELHKALRPIASLIRKSEKAQQKLAPGMWQHAMLRDNVKALRLASALMNKETNATQKFTRDDLQRALRAFAAMMSRTDKTRARFSPGTSQHSLQRNRLEALRIMQALTKVELDRRNA
jgi:hypothetical protein